MDASKEFSHLLAARVTLFWVVTQEERRVERMLASAQIARKVEATRGPGKFLARFWDCASGCTEFNPTTATFDPVAITTSIPDAGEFDDSRNPQAVFNAIRAGVGVPVDPDNPGAETRGASVLWILRDLDAFLRDPLILRGLRTLAHDLEDESDPARTSAVVVLTTSDDVPACLRDECSVIRWPLPSREEVRGALALTLQTNHSRVEEPYTIDDAVDAAMGLTMQDAHTAFCYSIVSSGSPARVAPGIVAARKKEVVSRGGLLTWYDPDPRGLDAIGGLDLLKQELLDLAGALSPEAQAFGLENPQGLLLAGPPGTGKSLIAKAAPAAFNLPLLRLDFGALKGGTVGASESNIRRALALAEAVAPCVLWADEIDTGLAGATAEYTGDSGVAKDQLGAMLTWRQECKKFVFLLATTNNPQRLPAPLLRAGRFNGTFFVDLPGAQDRENILGVSLRALPTPRDPELFDLAAVASAAEGFSGAELDAAVSAALRQAWRERRELSNAHLVAAVRPIVPYSRSNAEEYQRLKAWAAQRARPAASPARSINNQPVAPRPVARMVAVESGE